VTRDDSGLRASQQNSRASTNSSRVNHIERGERLLEQCEERDVDQRDDRAKRAMLQANGSAREGSDIFETLQAEERRKDRAAFRQISVHSTAMRHGEENEYARSPDDN